jgi:hypothetical protein
MRRVLEQEGGSIRAPGVPTAGDRQATKSGIVLVLRSAPWGARVKWKVQNSDVLCRRRVVRRQGGGNSRAPGVPSAGDRQATKSGIVPDLRSAPWSARVKWRDRDSDVLCRRRVVRRQGGGSIRASGVPSAGDQQATKSGSVLVLQSTPWSVRVKRKARNADILCCRRVVRRVQEQEGGLVYWFLFSLKLFEEGRK